MKKSYTKNGTDCGQTTVSWSDYFHATVLINEFERFCQVNGIYIDVEIEYFSTYLALQAFQQYVMHYLFFE